MDFETLGKVVNWYHCFTGPDDDDDNDDETDSLLPVINASARREHLDISIHELPPR